MPIEGYTVGSEKEKKEKALELEVVKVEVDKEEIKPEEISKEPVQSFESLYLNPRERQYGIIGGGTSRTLRLPGEEILMSTMATMYDIKRRIDERGKEYFEEVRNAVGFLYVTNMRILFEVKPFGFVENYAEWAIPLEEITEVRAIRGGFLRSAKFGGGIRKRLQIRYKTPTGEILTKNFLSARVGGGFLRTIKQIATGRFLFRTLEPDEWERSVLQYIQQARSKVLFEIRKRQEFEQRLESIEKLIYLISEKFTRDDKK